MASKICSLLHNKSNAAGNNQSMAAAFNQFKNELLSSGRNPQDILNELLRSGKVSQQQLNEARSKAKLFSSLLKI